MTVTSVRMVIALGLILATTGQAFAGLCGLVGSALRKHSLGGCVGADACYDIQCHTVMKTMTRTVYETVTETRYKTVYDTTYETKFVEGVERIPVVNYVDQTFTYNRPHVEYLTKEVPYTFTWPAYETVTKDVSFVTYVPTYETKTRHVPYTTYQTVTETRTRTEHFTVPRTIHYTQTVPVYGGRWQTVTEEQPGPVIEKCVQEPGCWKWDPCCCRCVYVPGACKRVQVQCPPIKTCRRVWVPIVEQREVQCSKVVYETRSREVPFTATRLVPQTHTRPVTYTVTRMMPVTQSRTVSYQVARMMSEQRTRTVTYPVTRMIPETGTRTVPVTSYREVPTSSTIVVPHSVPRTVAYNVTRCVPRTETYQVPVRVCVSVPRCSVDPCDGAIPCDGGAGDADDMPAEDTPPRAPEEEVPAPEESAPTIQAGLQLTALATRDLGGESSADGEAGGSAASASLLFNLGLSRLRSGDAEGAIRELESACAAAERNAKYAYFLAVAQRRGGLEAEADRTLSRAIELERRHGIANWGRTMQRVQGAERLWLEDARRAAGL